MNEIGYHETCSKYRYNIEKNGLDPTKCKHRDDHWLGQERRGDMMFDKELFLSLCEKYDVELSVAATSPMINEGGQVHVITDDDVGRIFVPYQLNKRT